MSGALARTPSHRLEPGTLIGGRFEIGDLLGEGGMGAVYAASDRVIDRRVAVKVLHLDGEQASKRFRQEAAAASRISSRHVAAVHDYGRDDELGCEFLVMELLEGHPLDAVIHHEGKLGPSAAAAIGADIADALAAAHAAKVVHRDLKPENIWILADGGVKVIDFGIAQMARPNVAAGSGITSPDHILGTPAYISPEMVAGEAVGPKADLYALGVILFEMLTGELPFHDDVPSALCTMHLREPPPAIGAIAPEVSLPDGYEELVAGLLEKSPALRPPAATEVAAILRPWGESFGTASVTGGRRLASVDTAVVSRRPAGRSRRRLVVIGVAVAVVALVGGAGLTAALLGTEPEAVVVEAPAQESEPTTTVSGEGIAIEMPVEPIEEPPPDPIALLELTLSPPAAVVRLDGELVTPPIALPNDASEHELEVRARGYRAARRTVRGDRDRVLEIRLRRRGRRRGLPAKLREW